MLSKKLFTFLLLMMHFSLSCVITPDGGSRKKKDKDLNEEKEVEEIDLQEKSNSPLLVFIGEDQIIVDQDGNGFELISFKSNHNSTENVEYEWRINGTLFSNAAKPR